MLGSFTFNYTVGKKTYEVSATSINDAITKVRKVHQIIGKPRSDLAIRQYCESVYKQRKESSLIVNNPIKNTMSIQRTGPIMWNFLNLFGVAFDQKYFLDTINYVLELLNPSSAISDASGCDDCYLFMKDYIEKDPPRYVTNKSEAAEWVNRFHNLVNQKLGKDVYTYERMVQEYGAPEQL